MPKKLKICQEQTAWLLILLCGSVSREKSAPVHVAVHVIRSTIVFPVLKHAIVDNASVSKSSDHRYIFRISPCPVLVRLLE